MLKPYEAAFQLVFAMVPKLEELAECPETW
jgi:hypothetical protein